MLGCVDFDSALALAFATTADRNLIQIGPEPERHAFCQINHHSDSSRTGKRCHAH